MPSSVVRLCSALATATLALHAHDPVSTPLKPTAAKPDLAAARKALNAAKQALAAQGRYACCTRSACDLCALTTGSCHCAANLADGKGACGECAGTWRARGKTVTLLPAVEQACPLPAHADHPAAQLTMAADALLRAKRTLVGEGRYACCIRGGCNSCAHETYCPCASDLSVKHKGVCGECLDGWRSGRGAFPNIDAAEVTLADPGADMDVMRLGPAAWLASGTSQVPAATPMDMFMRLFGRWTLMGSANAFLTYSDQSGPRGRDKLFSTNQAMLMASHRLGRATVALHAMLSAEPATVTGQRYPLLFASGETANGVPIVNGQHPHDLFMELAASVKFPVGERTAFHFYGGPRGEPALGPPAYPHRASASENPMATIGHHLQDSTHIATNVITAGVTHGPVTWEVSGFHAREPDELRWGIESGGIDSLSTRLTVNPAPRWSAQFSIGRLNRVEITHPLRPALRTTASVIYSTGAWSTTALWGRNNDLSYTQLPGLPAIPRSGFRPLHVVSVPTRIPAQIYNSFLLESTLHRGRNWFWMRAENADKDSTLLFEESPLLLLVDEVRLARVQAYTAGFERDLPLPLGFLRTGLGGQVTLFHAPPILAPIYDANPVGAQVFLRARWGASKK
jgi:hypothetical protein